MQDIQIAACPKCGKSDAKKLTYTWWGGAFGPKLLNHVKCNECGTQYNGKTGQSNTVSIIVYMLAMIFIFFILFTLLQLVMASI
jgi:uncharacterized Zn finger protein